MIYHFDYETTSAADIKYGAARYACDPSTRILMFSICDELGDPVLWRFNDPEGRESVKAKYMLQRAVDTGSLIYAHNVAFEMFVSDYRLKMDVGVTPPTIGQLRCTMAMCRRASVPPSLAKASEFLKLGVDKDKRGKMLIGVFSDQSKMVTIHHGKESRKSSSPILESPIPWDWTMTLAGDKVTVREAWEMFCDYCKTDAVVEREIHRKLSRYELDGAELDGFQFTSSMNALGAPVNISALRHAQDIVDNHRSVLEKTFRGITGLMPSQTAKVLEWLRAEGYPGENLTSAAMHQWNGSSFMSDKGREALRIRADLSFAAVKKTAAMLNTACPNSRLKGMFTWYGAGKTGRWTSNGVQLQNAKRPTVGNPEEVYSDICSKLDIDTFGQFYANPYECVASVIRNFVQPADGMILSVDYSNIESRVAAWIAGQDDLLDSYRQGRDAYKELASSVFNVRVEDVTKDQRFVGKIGNLSLVYQTGAKTFHETCATWGMPIEKKIACLTVKTFRETYNQFPVTWRRFESAAVKAINDPGKWYPANDLVSFALTKKAPFPRLLMRLPSGRDLTMPYPEVRRAIKKHKDYETGETREWETDEISFYGSMRNSANWGRVLTYAGDLFQSSVQGTARDIMQHGCVTAHRAGYRIFSIIHDEVLAHDDHPDGVAGLELALCSHPTWLPEDFPLSTSASVTPYYTK